MRLPCPSLAAAFRTRSAVVLVLGAFAVVVCSLAPGCRKSPETPKTAAVAAQPAVPAETPVPASVDCRSCHQDIYKSWAGSHHALAHREVDQKADADAFGQVQEFSAHGIDYRLEWQDGKPVFTEKRGTSPVERYIAEYVLGHTPIKQYVVPTGNGRFQAAELIFDPLKKEWLNVFGDERRQPGEWGHWRGRGMNWNSMCAHCHMTGYKKNYDAVRDVYTTTWREHGVGCAQCHAMPADHATNPRKKTKDPGQGTQGGKTDLEIFAAHRQQAQETCAPCHARNELLTGDVKPGVKYNDYYRLTLPTEASVFYPDGQMRDEDFNYTSLLTSRMGGKAGVTCLDCHDPHSGKTILPAQNNMLCMQCHGGSGGRLSAPVIDPIAHSRHLPGSTGHQCISCHMPTTTYMQRDPRHDHGFIKPDPLLTKELGIPNACNRCHTDKSVDWAIEHTDRWYGDKMNSRQRDRARAVAAAQAHKPDAAAKLLALIATEEVPAWKATLTLLTRNYASEAHVIEAARTATRDADPLVRSAGTQVLSSVPREVPGLRPLLNDASRLVRLDAAWPLSPEIPDGSPNRRELDAYLAVSADQPTGRMRIGQDLFNRGRAAEAEGQLRKATEWDPNSAGLHDALGLILNELNRPEEAAASLWRAARLDTGNAQAAFNAALAFAGASKLADAEFALREAIRRDARFDRAYYNLALLLNQTGRVPDALTALQTAEQLAPQVADYPYARATILFQRGDRTGAAAAARKALAADPAHAQAQALLRQAGG